MKRLFFLALLLCHCPAAIQDTGQETMPRRDVAREWVSDSGNHRFVAQFVRLESDAVTLRSDRENREATVPLSRLAIRDQAIAKCFAEQPIVSGFDVVLGDVTDVVDGDTVHFKTVWDQELKVRLLDIDTPESDQPFGLDATNALKSLTVNAARTGPARFEWNSTDKYGRILARLYVDGTDVCAEMVKRGFAWNFDKYSVRPEFETFEDAARKARLGLWSDSRPEAPWDFRERQRTEAQAKTALLESAKAEAKGNELARKKSNEEPRAEAEPTTSSGSVPLGLMSKPTAPGGGSDPTVYVTETGKKYHRDGCKYLRKSKIPMKLSDAKKIYDPCKVCKPPQ